MANKKILVVEDSENLLKLETILLTLNGYEVKGVADGQSALDALAEDCPDLVLLDIMLPKVDGITVCRHVKGNPDTEHVPVIIISAKKRPEEVACGERAGADLYLSKPFKSSTVIEAIQDLIDH